MSGVSDAWRPCSEDAVLLGDGRRLGFAEWGDRAGAPVVFCHGGAMSRLSSIGWSMVSHLGVRLLSVERPGHGLSDPRPGWRLLDWPDDVAQLADRLGIERFAVAGMSAGGPPALACGYALPDRVTVVGMVATIVNPERYEPDEMSRLVESDPDAARRLARESFAGMVGDVDAHVAAMADRPGPDGAVYADPTVQASFRANRREAFRQGLDGPADDIVQMNRPWGFSFDDVTVPVHYWLGDQDHLTSVDLVRDCIEHLPNYQLTVYPGEGHAIGFTHGDEILAAMLARMIDSQSSS